MKDRIEPLILERAPWMARRGPCVKTAWKVMDRLLRYQETLQIAQSLKHDASFQIMSKMADRLCHDVSVKGLGNVPARGKALIIANHPTGIADGIVLHSVLRRIRDDHYFFANSDILRVLPQMREMIAPVEWRTEKRCREKTRETMAYVRNATVHERLGVIFPAGRLAKRKGLQLHERPWMSSAAMLARKLALPVIPINIQARNSLLFYLLDTLHPTLRDITLFHEALNKDRQPFRITIGEAIAPEALPRNATEAIGVLRAATLGLSADSHPTVGIVRNSRSWA